MARIVRAAQDYRNVAPVAAGGVVPLFNPNYGEWGIVGDHTANPGQALLRIRQDGPNKYMRLTAAQTIFDNTPTDVSARDVEFQASFPILTGYPTGAEISIIDLRVNEITNKRIRVTIATGAKQILIAYGTAGADKNANVSANFLETLPTNTRVRLKIAAVGPANDTDVIISAFTLDNANGETPLNEWGGTNTITVPLDADNVAEYGICFLVGTGDGANGSHLDGIAYLSEGSAAELFLAEPALTIGHDSIEAVYPDGEGGTPAYTYDIYDVSDGSPPDTAGFTNRISTTQTANLTDLEPDTVYRLATIITDADDNTYRRDTSITTWAVRHDWKVLYYGDSTFQGGGVNLRHPDISAKHASVILGYPNGETFPYDVHAVPGTALADWTVEQRNALRDKINNEGYNVAVGQPGILDGDPAAETAAERIGLADFLLAECPGLVHHVLQHHNATGSPYTMGVGGSEFTGDIYTPETHLRNRQIQDNMISLNGGLRRAYEEGRFSWVTAPGQYDANLNHIRYDPNNPTNPDNFYANDLLHMDTDGYQWGAYAGGAFLAFILRGGWGIGEGGGGGVAPTVLTASVPANGLTVGLLFSEAVVNNSGLSVRVNGVIRAHTPSGTGDTRTLTLASAVYVGDVVTFSYDVPSGNINSVSSGVELEAYNNAAVTNNSTVPAPDTTAPAFLSASVASDGVSLQLNLTEAGSSPMLPVSGGLGVSVRVNGALRTVSGLARTGALQFTGTIAGVVYNTDEVTVSYSQSTGNITDTAGNELAAFTNQAVVNNSTVEVPEEVAPVVHFSLTLPNKVPPETIYLTAGDTSGRLRVGLKNNGLPVTISPGADVAYTIKEYGAAEAAIAGAATVADAVDGEVEIEFSDALPVPPAGRYELTIKVDGMTFPIGGRYPLIILEAL